MNLIFNIYIAFAHHILLYLHVDPKQWLTVDDIEGEYISTDQTLKYNLVNSNAMKPQAILG